MHHSQYKEWRRDCDDFTSGKNVLYSREETAIYFVSTLEAVSDRKRESFLSLSRENVGTKRAVPPANLS